MTDYPTLAQERGEAPVPCVDERWRQSTRLHDPLVSHQVVGG